MWTLVLQDSPTVQRSHVWEVCTAQTVARNARNATGRAGRLKAFDSPRCPKLSSKGRCHEGRSFITVVHKALLLRRRWHSDRRVREGARKSSAAIVTLSVAVSATNPNDGRASNIASACPASPASTSVAMTDLMRGIVSVQLQLISTA